MWTKKKTHPKTVRTIFCGKKADWAAMRVLLGLPINNNWVLITVHRYNEPFSSLVQLVDEVFRVVWMWMCEGAKLSRQQQQQYVSSRECFIDGTNNKDITSLVWFVAYVWYIYSRCISLLQMYSVFQICSYFFDVILSWFRLNGFNMSPPRCSNISQKYIWIQWIRWAERCNSCCIGIILHNHFNYAISWFVIQTFCNSIDTV